MTIGRRAIAERSRGFAARIARRHARVRAFDASLARVFARLAPAMNATNRHRHHHTHLRPAPWLTLSLTHMSAPSERNGASRALATDVVTRHTAHVERTERTRRELVERLVARTIRHERQRTPAPDRIGAVTPAPRVLRKPAPLIERDDRPAPRAAPVASPAVRASLSALSAHEVNQLTDTVIRSLDRRLSAARERRGHG